MPEANPVHVKYDKEAADAAPTFSPEVKKKDKDIVVTPRTSEEELMEAVLKAGVQTK